MTEIKAIQELIPTAPIVELGKTCATMMSPGDVEGVISLIRATRPDTILEIGTHVGETTADIALCAPESTVFTIDICREMGIEFPETKYRFCAGISSQCVLPKKDIGKVYKYLKCRNVIQIFGDTTCITTWREVPKQIDFFFIDGCHFYEYVINDTLYALSRNPQVIVWHDSRTDADFFIMHVRRALKDIEQRLLGPIYDVTESNLAFWIHSDLLSAITTSAIKG